MEPSGRAGWAQGHGRHNSSRKFLARKVKSFKLTNQAHHRKLHLALMYQRHAGALQRLAAVTVSFLLNAIQMYYH